MTVYKLVTEDTVDEAIFLLGERKRQLSEAVLANTGNDERISGNLDQAEDDIGTIGRILQNAMSRVGAN